MRDDDDFNESITFALLFGWGLVFAGAWVCWGFGPAALVAGALLLAGVLLLLTVLWAGAQAQP